MRNALSPGTGRRYPLKMICAVFRVSRSTVYRTTAPAPAGPVIAAKRGPKTTQSDAEVVAAIHAVLAATPFHGEGYRKVRARLAHRGLAVGGKRVLRLMRVHHLLAPRCKFSVNLRHCFSARMCHRLGHRLCEGRCHSWRERGCLLPWHAARSSF